MTIRKRGDEVKDLERRCLDRTVPTGPRVVPWSGDRAGRQRPTRERREDGAMRPPAHGQLGPPELEEARRGLSLRASRGVVAPQTAWFHASALQSRQEHNDQ